MKLTNQTYADMNLVPVTDNRVTIGETPDGQPSISPRRWLWPAVALGVLVIAGFVGGLILLRRRGRPDQASGARDRFRMPEEIDGFVVVRLLKGLQANLGPAEHAAVREDIERVERAVFTPHAPGLSENQLREIAGKWLARLN